MSTKIDEVKAGLNALHHQANMYFQDSLKLVKQKMDGLPGHEAYRIEKYYWSHMTAEERERGERIVKLLIEVMSKIAIAVKQSPLLDEADQREIVIHTKTMRSAIYFRRYLYRGPEPIYEDGLVMGVSPAEQSEDDITVEGAQRQFQTTYDAVIKIVNLVIHGVSDLSSVSLSQQGINKYRPNTAFIMMWMDRDHPELDDVRDAIKSTFQAFGIKAVRADDIEHEDMITKRILDEIATSEFLIADLTAARPSVYYEVGFAHALGKRVIMYRKKGTPLHFDLAVHNCPEYENLAVLKSKLHNRLQALTNKTPV